MRREERLIFTTMINRKEMEIWDRPGHHHPEYMKSDVDTWWLKLEKWPQPENPVEGTDFDWVPWRDRYAKRPCWEVRVREYNSTKSKWGETRIDSGAQVTIKCNGRRVYSFGCRDIEYAFAKAQVTITHLMEHSVRVWELDKEIGRKIWYRGQPAILELVDEDGTVIVRYDGEGTGFDMRDPWDKDDEESGGLGTSEWHGKEVVHVGPLLDITDRIWWFRKDKEKDP